MSETDPIGLAIELLLRADQQEAALRQEEAHLNRAKADKALALYRDQAVEEFDLLITWGQGMQPQSMETAKSAREMADAALQKLTLSEYQMAMKRYRDLCQGKAG